MKGSKPLSVGGSIASKPDVERGAGDGGCGGDDGASVSSEARRAAARTAAWIWGKYGDEGLAEGPQHCADEGAGRGALRYILWAEAVRLRYILGAAAFTILLVVVGVVVVKTRA